MKPPTVDICLGKLDLGTAATAAPQTQEVYGCNREIESLACSLNADCEA